MNIHFLRSFILLTVKHEVKKNLKFSPTGKSKRMSRDSKVCQHSFVFYITRLLLPYTTENKTMLWVPLSSAKDFNSRVSALPSLCFY